MFYKLQQSTCVIALKYVLMLTFIILETVCKQADTLKRIIWEWKKDKNSGKMLAALRDLAKTDLKLAEILKSHNLL